jgi:predicted lipid-binding transport protein (Tim44 family)
MLRTHRLWIALLALVAAVSFTIVAADARPSGSSGSRGSRTYSAPAPTATAPKGAAPIERTTTQPTTRPAAAQTGSTVGQATRPGGLFGGGLLGGLAAGFIGAGLFGLLFGHGLAGGLGGFASMFGLLLQIVIVVVVARLIWTWWQRRNQPAYAGEASLRQGLNGGSNRLGLGGLGGLGGFGGGAQTTDTPLQLKPEDFDAFERLNSEILLAYGKEDLTALRSRVTPEMLSYYSEELSRNASNGDVNQISDVKLLQGDLSEAWREGQDEYATLAMRYSLKDRMVARDDGRLIEELPSEATEHWTFRRVPAGQWVLSAVQQNG